MTQPAFPHRLALASLILAFASPALAQQGSDPGRALAEQIIQDVIGQAANSARAAVSEQTGIDPFHRGYEPGRDYRPLRSHSSDGTLRDLLQLDQEHDREVYLLEEELHRELGQARAEFRRDAAAEQRRDKIRDKRHKLQEKVDRAYARFNDKMSEHRQRYDRKREDILARERRHDGPSAHGKDRAAEARGRGQDRGHGRPESAGPPDRDNRN